MVSSKKDEFVDDSSLGGSDQENQPPEDIFETNGSNLGSSGQSDIPPESQRNVGREIGLTERLRDIFRDEGDGDLLLQQSEREDGVLQWLQALDFQVVGACRADERLKPLLKLNVASGAAEDRLLAHLSQHFEAPEVGVLARCLCIPLVSIRVGKVIKNGTLLCPTATRGNLNLTLLPSSDLRISFTGDDSCAERLALLSADSENSTAAIEEISADGSGRSFLMKLPGGQISYFWCSEKSKLLGAELLTKMKGLLRRKPSLSQLTGISDSRLNCFATHLRAYLLGSGSSMQSTPAVSSDTLLSDFHESHLNTQSTFPSSKSFRFRPTTTQPAKSHSSVYQGSLSPRLNTFKDGLQRNSSSIRSVAREKLKQRVDCHFSVLAIDNPFIASSSTFSSNLTSSSGQTEDEKLSQGNSYCQLMSSGSPDTVPFNPPSSFSSLSLHAPHTQVPASSPSLFSPYYCWCPPFSSTLQYTVAPHLPSTSMESLSLPPLSSLLSAARSSNSLVLPNPSLDLADIPSFDFPAFLPDPLARIPLPVSSFVTMPSSQQIATFTPFMSDPIVHIPVIDVCSSGQGYLVSAGTTISTTIAPLLPNLVNPLIPEAESVVEKSARETLRLLIGSTQPSTPLMEMLPAAFTTTDKSISYIHGKKQSALVAGSRGLYNGTGDVEATTNSVVSARRWVSVVGDDDFEEPSKRSGNYLENWEDHRDARGNRSEQNANDDDDDDAHSSLHDEWSSHFRQA